MISNIVTSKYNTQEKTGAEARLRPNDESDDC
jgi:hypothetical protein